MTLVLAIPCSDGVVLASDGQITMGNVRAVGQKLYRLNNYCAWGASGELALIQRVQQAISSLDDRHLSEFSDILANIIRNCVLNLIQLDFRTQFFQNNPDALLQLHQGDFVFVDSRQPQYRILHITSYGTPEWIDRPFASGNGAMFAYALLQKYQGMEMVLQQANILAFKVIEEAIDVGSYGLGMPINIWNVKPSNVQELSENQLAAVADAATQLREAEIQLLFGGPSTGGRIDRMP